MIAEGLIEIYTNAGFEVRQPGCSSCLAMNEDKIPQVNMPFQPPTETLKADRDLEQEHSLQAHSRLLLQL